MNIVSILMGLTFVLMWSSAFTASHIAVTYASPLLLLSVRFLLSGTIAVLLARALGQTAPPGRRQWAAVILFGILQNGVYLGSTFVALQTIDAGLGAIIASLLPLTVAAANWVVFRESLPPLGILGLLLGTIGVAVIMGARLSGGADIYGVVLMFVGVAALTGATLLVRGASGAGNVLMIVGLQMLVGSAVLFPASLLLETWRVDPTWQLAAAFAYATLIPGLAATLIWFLLVGRIGATRAASFHFLNPFLGVAIAALVLGEALSLRDILGVFVIMAGIIAVQTSRRI